MYMVPLPQRVYKVEWFLISPSPLWPLISLPWVKNCWIIYPIQYEYCKIQVKMVLTYEVLKYV